MDSSQLILLLIVIFFIILFILLIIYIVEVGKNNLEQGSMDYLPPPDYMANIGSRCPDYWKFMGQDPNGRNICKNTMNIPVWNPDNKDCYDDKKMKTKNFYQANIAYDKEKKEYLLDNRAQRQMCKFVSQCGPSQNLEASWLGINSSGISKGYASCGNL